MLNSLGRAGLSSLARHRHGGWLAFEQGLLWSAALAASWALDDVVDLGSQALPLVLAAAASALTLPAWGAALAGCFAVVAFNWLFVPPRGTLNVDFRGHLVLLAVMLPVSLGVAMLVSRLRSLAEQAARQSGELRELLALGEQLRQADDAAALQQALQPAVSRLGLGPVALLAGHEASPAAAGSMSVSEGEPASSWAGELDDDERTGLWQCRREGLAYGPGTGRYEYQGRWFLPLRGQGGTVGAVLLRPKPGGALDEAARAQVQAMVDQVGLVVERLQAQRAAAAQSRQAQDHQVRNTILAAVSHDYRTPLAAIMSAASVLRDQAARLATPQRERLASHIVDEVAQLGRLTDNALQLARLDAPGVPLRLDWESAEELVGSVLARVRQRDPQRRVRARIEPGLPLLRCQAVMVVQLLENLVDNALQHTPADAPVEVRVRLDGPSQMLIAVRDRGPGVPPAARERIFEVFQRGETADGRANGAPPDAERPRGAGVGLAVCRAIAQAHGGSLRYRARAGGGASFECRLPLGEAPDTPDSAFDVGEGLK